ncbi:MAG: hypothetical protein QG622_2421 [Actinomycetota bacterium]|nr:hypothetical protein [Actinomycetota bacterium]
MTARLADIAAQAGVSEATVSRVLNGRPGVADTTRQAVLTALDVLGYERPSRLRPRSAGLVGLIVPELDNPIFPAFAQAMETSLARRGLTLVLCTQTPGGVHEDEYTRMLLDRGVSGIVYVSGLHADSSADPERYRSLRARGLRIVLVNGYLPGLRAPFVSNDDIVAMELAVGHLASLGHRRIGLAVGPRQFVPVVRKMTGFIESVRRHVGTEDAGEWIESCMFTVEGGALAADRLLRRGATGIVCGSDLMALGAIRAARSLGLAVPDDVSVVGSDDSLLIAFTDPPLTTVRQPIVAMAEASVRALLDEPVDLVSSADESGGEYVFRPELVVRSSTARCVPYGGGRDGGDDT